MKAMKWIIFPPPREDRLLKPGDKVFIKTKSTREIGRKGHITDHVQLCDGLKTFVKTKEEDRLHVKIPITSRKKQAPGIEATVDVDEEQSFYTASFRPSRLVPVFDTSSNALVVLTKTTNKYRLLAASQLDKHDHVLEIGCSNGECSLIISKYVSEGSLVGFDVSQEMIREAEKKVSSAAVRNHARFHKIDPFTQPKRALLLSTVDNEVPGADNITANSSDKDGKESQNPKPTVVFIDIGGNRDLQSVIRMLAWVKKSCSPRLVIIKSEAIVECVESDNGRSKRSTDIQECKRQKTNDSAIIEACGRIRNGEDWFRLKVNELTNVSSKEKGVPGLNSFAPKFSHPKKAPLALSPDENKPICRYYNYHKNGCKQSDCPYDHNYCHWCLQKGHIALNCKNPQV